MTGAGAVVGVFATDFRGPAALQTHLVLFVVQGLLLITLVSELRRTRRIAEREARIAHAARLEGEAANRLKDEFLSTISHELRTPLNAVLGWMHLIGTGKLDDRTTRRAFESIERNVRLQAQLTSDLLDMSKSLTGRLKIDSRPVSIRSVVEESVRSIYSCRGREGRARPADLAGSSDRRTR